MAKGKNDRREGNLNGFEGLFPVPGKPATGSNAEFSLDIFKKG
jgi:hypothetical protein